MDSDLPYDVMLLVLQAKKRTAADCRARFLMLMRARQAAKTPQPLPTPAQTPYPSHPQASIQYNATGLALPTLLAQPGGAQAQHVNMLANALAPQSRPAALASASTHQLPPAVATARAATPLPGPATLSQPVATASMPNSNVQPASDSLRAMPAAPTHLSPAPLPPAAAVPLPTSMAAAAVNTGPAAGTAPLTAVPHSSAAAPSSTVAQPSTGLPPGYGHIASLNPNAPVLPQPTGTASATLAYLLAAKASQAATSKPTAVADITAVAGSGRAVRLVHRSSADVLRIKLRLVDLVQGSSALQPKVML